MNLKTKKEVWRWMIWALVLAVLIICGRTLTHLKHMEIFLLILALGCLALVLIFRKLREKT